MSSSRSWLGSREVELVSLMIRMGSTDNRTPHIAEHSWDSGVPHTPWQNIAVPALFCHGAGKTLLGQLCFHRLETTEQRWDSSVLPSLWQNIAGTTVFCQGWGKTLLAQLCFVWWPGDVCEPWCSTVV